MHTGNSLKIGQAPCTPGFYPAIVASRIPTVLWRGPGVKNGMPASLSPSQALPGWRLEHSYARLPELFHKPWKLAPVRAPRLVVLNRPLARTLGLDPDVLEREENAAVFAGNKLPDGANPLAQAYAGHQFGNFTGLGDGRALLLGEQITPEGARYDIQLKGSGRTPFSRGGDGRAALGPMLREWILSEAMHALEIPTTRSLAVAATGEWVERKERLPGAVLTRVAASHVRVGTFQWAAAHEAPDALQALADYTLRRHYPDLAEAENPTLALLEAVLERQAELVARWLHVGFIHGVMNTDNMSLSGETIDYGPCAFLDHYDPATTFSSIDRGKRYAFANQPGIAQWNLARLAEALLPVLHPEQTRALDAANAAIHAFPDRFKRQWLAGFRAKLGLFTEEAGDEKLSQTLLDWMEKTRADYTNTFLALSSESALDTAHSADPAFGEWHAQWRARRSRQPQTGAEVVRLMRTRNPAVIPRNHKVEQALSAATDHGDLAPMERLLAVLAQPYAPGSVPPPEFLEPAPPSDTPYQTFCGT